MKITSAKIKNFMGHKELAVETIGDVLSITGANESGKSSLLKAIKCAFSSKGEKVDLIRDGSEFAEIEITTDADLSIRRRVRPIGSNDSLTVLKGGAELRSPQTMLASLFSSIQLNPLDFMELTSEKALEAVLGAFPLPPVADLLTQKTGGRIRLTKPDSLGQINETIAALMDERKGMKSEAKGLRIQAEQLLQGVPAGFDSNQFDGVSMDELIASQKRAIAHNASCQAAAEHRVRLVREIELLEQQMKEKREALAEADKKGSGMLMDLAETNSKIAAYAEWRNQKSAHEAAQKKIALADDMDQKIERKSKGLDWLRGLPAQLLNDTAKIEGVRISDGRLEVLNKGGEYVAFANASESARLYYAVKIAKAMAPADGLRLILVDGAERMDAARREELLALCAAEPAFQLVIAQVSDGELAFS